MDKITWTNVTVKLSQLKAWSDNLVVYFSCVDCGKIKSTIASRKHARCHSCENKRRAIPIIDGNKKCRSCGIEKPLADFGMKLGGICKKCQSKKSAKWNADNKSRKNENNKKSRDRHLIECHARDRKYYIANQEKKQEYARVYRANNKDVAAEYKRKWFENNKDKKVIQSHRRRARKLNVLNTLTSKEWNDIYNSYLGRCVYCGAAATEQDHIIPFYSGGTNTADNVVPACKNCNVTKGKKSLIQFMNYRAQNGRV